MEAAAVFVCMALSLVIAAAGFRCLRENNKKIKDLAKRIHTIDGKFKALSTDKPFCCETATEDEMRARCREKGKGSDYTGYMVDCFIVKLSHKELSAKYNIADRTSVAYKKKRKQELEGGTR